MTRVIKNPRLDELLHRAQGMKGDELLPYLNHYLENHPNVGEYCVQDNEKKPDGYFHPSGDTMACKRYLFFRMHDAFVLEPDVIPLALRKTFKVGQAVHSMVQAWLRDMGHYNGYPLLVGDEVRIFSEELWVSGSVDAVLRFPSGVEKALEIKTMNSREFGKLTSPKALHVLQLLIYMYVLGHDEGIILYIEKDYPHELKEFRVTMEHPPMDIFRRWAKVREALAAGDCSGLEYECKEGSKDWERCPARNICRRVM